MVKLAVEHLHGEHTSLWIQQLEQVAEGVSRDRLTRTELQLLPVLASALDEALPDHPATSIALGTKRRAAAEGLLARSAATHATDALNVHGIPVAPLKGLALEASYAELGWRRPMGDADLLILASIPWSVIVDALHKAGFTQGPRTTHARNFDLPDSRRVDVHQYMSPPNAYPDAVETAIMASTFSDPDEPLNAQLSPEFHVAHAIEHAMRWNPIPPARSISDIAVLQQTSPNLDWALVHRLLVTFGADRSGFALLTSLERAGIVSRDAVPSAQWKHHSSDGWLQAWSTADPRKTWLAQPIVFVGLIPWRLRRHNRQFSYRAYLRDLWGLAETDSIPAAIWQRMKSRLAHGRNRPEFNHE